MTSYNHSKKCIRNLRVLESWIHTVYLLPFPSPQIEISNKTLLLLLLKSSWPISSFYFLGQTASLLAWNTYTLGVIIFLDLSYILCLICSKALNDSLLHSFLKGGPLPVLTLAYFSISHDPVERDLIGLTVSP